MTRKIALACCASLLTAPLAAQEDPRIIEEVYNSDAVYAISISAVHATVIQLQSGEAVQSIVVGDADGWIVEATASADRVVVKPTPNAQSTNMILVTTKRSYAFTLDAYGGTDVFLLRFDYGDGDEAKPKAADASYRFRGDRALYPRLMSDNGQTTSIYWNSDTPFPAVFAIDGEGDETAASYRAAGDGLIVEGVHEKLVFRSGREKATASRRAREERR